MDLGRGSNFDEFGNSLCSNFNPYSVKEISYQKQTDNILSIEIGGWELS